MTNEIRPYSVGDELEVRVEKIVPRGLGLAFAEKLTVFVPLGVAGDRIRAKIVEIKKRIAFAEIVEILEPSPRRIAPTCPHFGTCGGCDFQQMSYADQLAAKVGIISDCLRRIGKIEYEGDIKIIPSPQDFQYRSRAKWHASREHKTLGYFRRDSHEVVDVETCPILTPPLQTELARLRNSIDWDTMPADGIEIDASSGDGGHVSIYSADLMEPTSEIAFTAHGEMYAFSARGFFQGNQLLIGELIDAALGDASGETALDLYCGVALFALPMSKKFKHVIGVEGNHSAINLAKQNTRHAGIENIRFVRLGVGDFLSGHDLANTDFILLDPPRSGTEKHTIRDIARLKPEQIAYISCEPSILARDLRMLLDRGYKIDSITALDLFPQTHHVETVARLSRS